MKVRLEVTLFWKKPPCFSCVNDALLMLISSNLHKKSEDVIKTRSTPASLFFKGQATRAVKLYISTCVFTDIPRQFSAFSTSWVPSVLCIHRYLANERELNPHPWRMKRVFSIVTRGSSEKIRQVFFRCSRHLVQNNYRKERDKLKMLDSPQPIWTALCMSAGTIGNRRCALAVSAQCLTGIKTKATR